jgi:hypothetical protein
MEKESEKRKRKNTTWEACKYRKEVVGKLLMGESGGKVLFFVTTRLATSACAIVLLCYCLIGGWESVLVLLSPRSVISSSYFQFSPFQFSPVLSCTVLY